MGTVRQELEMESILGVRVANLTAERLLQLVDEDIAAGTKRWIVAINPEKIMKAREDEGLRRLLDEADYPIADGVGVLLASRLQGGRIRQRLTGIDSMLALCRHAAQKGYRVFLLGAKPGVAERAAGILASRYPGLQVAGTQDGYFQEAEPVIRRINEARPDILFVAMGSPKQEQWIRRHMSELVPTIFQGVGGSYDVICGNIPRAPEWMQRAGLEWLYRLLREPSRWRRQLALPRFLLAVLRQKSSGNW